MVAAGVETKQPESAIGEETCSAKAAATKRGEGLRQYYLQHIHEHQLLLRQKTHNLNRLEAQRNELKILEDAKLLRNNFSTDEAAQALRPTPTLQSRNGLEPKTSWRGPPSEARRKL